MASILKFIYLFFIYITASFFLFLEILPPSFAVWGIKVIDP